MDQMNRNDELSAGLQPTRETDRGGSTFETVKTTFADKLHDAASAIQQKVAGNESSPASGYAGQAAGWLDDAADYIRKVDPQKVKSDVKDQVRRNPGRSLLVAGAAGLVLGILLRR